MDTSTPKKSDDLGIIFDTPPAQEKAGAHADGKESHLTNHGDVFDVTKVFASEHGEAGTIISDKKRTHASVGSSLGSAFREWWGNASGSVRNSVGTLPALIKHDEGPTIAKASTRSDIVQEAAQHSTIAPKDDHHVVLEQFHTFKSDMARITGTPGIVLKQPAKKSIMSRWGHDEPTPVDTPKTPPQQSESIDFRHSMIAPEVNKKIRSEVPVVAPKPIVPQTPVPHTEKPLEKMEPVKIASMQIPNAVPKNPVVVPQDVMHRAKPLFSRESVPTPEKKEVSPLPEMVHEAEKVVPPMDDSAPTWLSARETKTETPIPEVIVAHMPIPQPVEQIPATPKPLGTTQKSTVSPIQLSTDPHTFPDAEIQSGNAKRSASHIQKPNHVSHALPHTKVTLTTWLIFGGIVALGITLAVVASIYVNVFKGEPTPTYAVTSFFSTPATVGIPLTADTASFATAFAVQAQGASGDGMHIYPTLQEGEVVRPATSKEFFTTLKMGIPRAFLNSLDDAFMTGVIITTKPEPFLIIRSYNFDELFAGLLAWEDTMQKDLTPLFGEPQEKGVLFTDAVASNKSTRILKDALGNEVLVYSFINQNTVIITTNGESLAALVSKF